MSSNFISKKNIFQFERLPVQNEVELFDDILKYDILHIERIISNGWNRIDDKWYDQENDEWVILIKGKATLAFENDQIVDLVEGDYLFIPSHCKHKVCETSNEPPAVWLAVHIKK